MTIVVSMGVKGVGYGMIGVVIRWIFLAWVICECKISCG